MRLRAAATTRRGSGRSVNQDTVAVAGWMSQAANGPVLVIESDASIGGKLACIVADGLGGHPAGEVASLMAAQQLTAGADEVQSPADLIAAIQHLSRRIVDQGHRNPDTKGMRTTVVGLIVATDSVLAFNVGDSRLFDVVDGMLYEISESDGLQVSQNSDSLAARSVVMQCLGSALPPTPHVWSLPIDRARRYILCSDGITNYAARHKLEANLKAEQTPEYVATQMLLTALDCGSQDDATVIVADVIPECVGPVCGRGISNEPGREEERTDGEDVGQP